MTFKLISLFKNWQKHKYSVFVIAACSFAFMSIGTASGWTSPSLVILTSEDSPIPVTTDELSWIASFLAIGGLTASIPYSYLLNKIGRQPMIIVVSLFYISGWIVLICAKTVLHLYIGRYLLGAAVGCTFGSIPVFVGEVIKHNIRGAVVTFLILSQSIGTLVSFGVGPVMHLQTLNIISMIFPVLMLLSFAFMPESPYFLLRSGKSEAAIDSLMKYRGCIFPDEVNEELKGMQKFLDEAPNSNFLQSLRQLFEPKSMKAIVIITVLLLGQQMSGIGAMTSYMQSIFNEVDLPIRSSNAVLISELLADISVITTSLIMDSFGRKPLYSISAVVCTFSNIALGMFYLFKAQNMLGSEYSWIPMVGVFVLRMGYDIGLAPVPMVVTSEILSFNIKGLVSAYFAFVQGASMAIVIKVFQIIKDEESLGQHVAHWIFASCIIVAMFFILYYMPETKSKSLLEIQEVFDNPKSKNNKKNNNTKTDNPI